MVSPLAYVHPEAQLAPDVEVAPFACIEANVVIGAGTTIGSNATICSGTRLGAHCRVFPGAVIGAVPQDLKFKGEDTVAVIGDNTTLREFVTVHRGTASKGQTVIGKNCLIMAYCHVAHDVCIHDNVIMSNATQLAGEVEVDDWAVIGGGTLVHQFSHIGAHVMIQGGSKINKDVPPFVTAAREPLQYCGINSVGLNRRGFTKTQIETIQQVYRLVFMSGLNMSQAAERVLADVPACEERDLIVHFIRSSPRGVIKGI